MSGGNVGERARLAREMVELGEELFGLALRGASGEGQEAEDEVFPSEELQQASEVYFRALRDLLGVEVKAPK